MLHALVAGELDDAAIRRQRSAQNGHASARLEGLGQRAHDFLSRSFARIGGFRGEGATGAGQCGAIHVAALDQALRDHAHAAGLIHIDSNEASAGFQIHQHGSAAADLLEIVNGQRDTRFARHGQQVQHGVGGAAGGRHAGDGVGESRARGDLARPAVVAHGVHDDLAAAETHIVFTRVHLRDRGGAHGRESDQFQHGGHGIGGELAAARARAGAGVVLDLQQFLVAHAAGGVGAHGFEDILNGDVAAVVASGQNRSAIQDDAGHVEPQQRHGRAGDGLVASHQRHDAVEHVAAGHQFDGIGNDFAADQRGLHAFGAHGDAIADGDGVELHRRAAGCANAFLYLDGQLAQVVVARHGFDPGVGDSDDGLGKVGIGEPDAFQHGARGRAVTALGDGIAVEGHVWFRLEACSLA